jgi:hypothetical protein
VVIHAWFDESSRYDASVSTQWRSRGVFWQKLRIICHGPRRTYGGRHFRRCPINHVISSVK